MSNVRIVVQLIIIREQPEDDSNVASPKELFKLVCICQVTVEGRLKTRDWKTQDHFTGVENARPVAMERQSYKKSITEVVVIVHY